MIPVGQLTTLRERFRWFATEARERSELYHHLSSTLVDRPEVLAVLAAAHPDQQRPNLLFAAVHDVLLSGADDPLAEHYPSVGGTRPVDAGTTERFAVFVQQFADPIDQRIRTRATQTNEPGRAAGLRPALAWVAGPDRPLALVELGGSAGLLLHLDRYRYRFGDVEVGPADARVRIEPQLRGTRPEQLEFGRVAARTGIDRAPLSPAAPDDARWLQACVWPEDLPRMRRLADALEVATVHGDVHQVRGDLVDHLVPAVHAAPADALVCVLHSAALAYLSPADRAAVEQQLDELGTERDLARVGLEGGGFDPFITLEAGLPDPAMGAERFVLGATTWRDGHREDRLLARMQPHGVWLDWLGGAGPVQRAPPG